MIREASALLLCVLGMGARDLVAQTLQGEVRGSQGNLPVSFALVRALDVRTGREVARVLTDSGGDFALRAAAGEEFVV